MGIKNKKKYNVKWAALYDRSKKRWISNIWMAFWFLDLNVKENLKKKKRSVQKLINAYKEKKAFHPVWLFNDNIIIMKFYKSKYLLDSNKFETYENKLLFYFYCDIFPVNILINLY